MGLDGGLYSFDFLGTFGVPVDANLMFGVVFIKLFFGFMMGSFDFLSKFCLTKFPDIPDLDEVYDFGFPLLLVYEGSFSLDATLLACRLPTEFPCSLFDIYLMLVFFLAC